MFVVDQLSATAGLFLASLFVSLSLFDNFDVVSAISDAAALQFDSTNILGGVQSELLYFQAHLNNLPLLLGLLAIIMSSGGLYRFSTCELEELRKIIFSAAAVALVAAWQVRFLPVRPELFFFAALTTTSITLLVGRMLIRTVPWFNEMMARHVVLVGDGLSPEELLHQLKASRSGKVSVLATWPLKRPMEMSHDELRRELSFLARAHGLSLSHLELLVAPAQGEFEAAQSVLPSLETLPLSAQFALSYNGLAREGVELYRPLGSDILFVGVAPGRRRFAQAAVKRAVDVLGAFFLLVLLLPLLGLIALLISSDGCSPFFRQERIGRGGKVFYLFKFRTMYVDAEQRLGDILLTDPEARAHWAKYQKLDSDPRITWIGDFLRRTSLDELPQLINVLLGDMSLVGPRPIMPCNSSRYAGDTAYARSPAFRYYAAQRPGITGLWQVSDRGESEYDCRMCLDRWYAMNWSLSLDFLILFKTLRVVFSCTGR